MPPCRYASQPCSVRLCPVVCGVCAGRADLDSYATGSASQYPKCPQCKQTVTDRVKIDIAETDDTREYIQLCNVYDNLVHRVRLGRWLNNRVKFSVTYPIISETLPLIKYVNSNVNQRNLEVDGFLDELERRMCGCRR